MSGQRILVTGAAGFIGRPAVRALVEAGFEVHTAGRRPPDAEPLVFHRTNLLEARDLRSLIEHVEPSHLLHLAWNVAPGRFWRDPANLDWVAASLRLFRAFAEGGGRRIVAAGTCAEYDWSHEHFVERQTPLAPRSLYGAAKHSLNMLMEAYSRQEGFSSAWGRVFYLYGPGEARGRLVSDITAGLLAGERVKATEGLHVRDFLHVEDAGRAFAALVTSDVEGPVNIASGEPTTVRRIMETIEELTAGAGGVDYGAHPMSPDDPRKMTADTFRLRQEIGFRPRYSLEEGLANTVRWWSAEGRPVINDQ